MLKRIITQEPRCEIKKEERERTSVAEDFIIKFLTRSWGLKAIRTAAEGRWGIQYTYTLLSRGGNRPDDIWKRERVRAGGGETENERAARGCCSQGCIIYKYGIRCLRTRKVIARNYSRYSGTNARLLSVYREWVIPLCLSLFVRWKVICREYRVTSYFARGYVTL